MLSEIEMNTKVCSKCREVKLLSEFNKKKASKDGHQSKCKACDKEYYVSNAEKFKERHVRHRAANIEKSKAYYRFNITKIKSYKAEYYVANVEKVNERNAKWRADNPEKNKEYQAKYRTSHSEKMKEYLVKYRANNSEKIKEYAAKYYLINVEKIRRYSAKWSQANPEKCRATVNKRRAAKLLAIPSWLTGEDYKAIDNIYTEAKRLEDETGIKHNVDHIHPLQGKLVCGLHCPSNLQILTESENKSKGNQFTPYVESEI